LRNHLEKELIYASMGEEIPPAEQGFTETPTGSGVVPLEKIVRDYTVKILKLHGFNKSQAARTLGISLSTLKRRLKKWHITVQHHLGEGKDRR
jgi:DNA-binding NtrC family response regulator